MVQEGNQMVRRALMIGIGVIIITNAKIGPGFQPQIVRFAWVVSRRVEVLFSV